MNAPFQTSHTTQFFGRDSRLTLGKWTEINARIFWHFFYFFHFDSFICIAFIPPTIRKFVRNANREGGPRFCQWLWWGKSKYKIGRHQIRVFSLNALSPKRFFFQLIFSTHCSQNHTGSSFSTDQKYYAFMGKIQPFDQNTKNYYFSYILTFCYLFGKAFTKQFFIL